MRSFLVHFDLFYTLCTPIVLKFCNIHSFLTCKVVFSVSIGVMNIRHIPADIEAAPVFAAIGKSYG